MIFDIPALIAYCSTLTWLRPGDVIAHRHARRRRLAHDASLLAEGGATRWRSGSGASAPWPTSSKTRPETVAELILYMSPGTCSRVTMTALEEIDVPFEDRLIFTGAGAQNSAAYLAVNRKGKVPALSVDGQVLTENPAILALSRRAAPSGRAAPPRR